MSEEILQGVFLNGVIIRTLIIDLIVASNICALVSIYPYNIYTCKDGSCAYYGPK